LQPDVPIDPRRPKLPIPSLPELVVLPLIGHSNTQPLAPRALLHEVQAGGGVLLDPIIALVPSTCRVLATVMNGRL
jgi:hypothetical protein